MKLVGYGLGWIRVCINKVAKNTNKLHRGPAHLILVTKVQNSNRDGCEGIHVDEWEAQVAKIVG